MSGNGQPKKEEKSLTRGAFLKNRKTGQGRKDICGT